MKVKIILYSILLFQFLSAQAQNEFVDITFGTNSGYTLSPTSEIDLFLRDVIEVNEKLYAVSTDYISNTFLLRYNVNGTLDSSFGSNGIITIPIIEVGGEVGDRFNQLMNTSDNKLLMINSTYPSSYEDSYISQVIKVNLDGTLDVNYGTNGRYLNSLEYGLAVIGVKKSPVDDLIIVGYNVFVNDESEQNITILKITAQGQLDTTFGIDGYITLPYNNEIFIPTLAQIKDEYVYMLFSDDVSNQYISKFNTATLSYDMSFGQNGQIAMNSGYLEMDSFYIDENSNDLYVSGGRQLDSNNLENEVIVKKFTEGVLDLSFANNGVATFGVLPGIDGKSITKSIARFGDKMLIRGDYITWNAGSYEKPFLAQINMDGSLDDSFGNNGIIITELFNKTSSVFDYIYNEDSIITCGYCPSIDGYYSQRSCLVKYLKSSNLNSTEFQNQNFSFYPNPVQDVVNFKTDINILSIDIYDYSGRLVGKYQSENNSINVAELRSGLYIAAVNSSTDSYKIKLVKE